MKNLFKRLACLALSVFFLFLTGCTPKEKTMLLPQDETQNMIGEITSSTTDFTVKKIYTYSYETNSSLEKSASLQGCKEYELHVIAEEEHESGIMLSGRQVDYRYGFYDLTGPSEKPWEDQTDEDLLPFWSLWPRSEDFAEGLDNMQEDIFYYPEKILPSPDVSQVLIYAAATYYDSRCIWLYDLNTQKPFLLYQGTLSGLTTPPAGLFSPDGHWVTFDAEGRIFNSQVPVYDCSREILPEDTLKERIELNALSSLYPPDHILPITYDNSGQLWAAGLFDFSGYPGILSIIKQNRNGSELTAYESYITGYSNSLSPGETENPTPGYFHSQYYPYGDWSDSNLAFQYELDTNENRLYYLDTPGVFWNINLKEGTTTGSKNFPYLVLDFLRLDSGDLLALTVQEAGMTYNTAAKYPGDSPLSTSQIFRYIQSADLYLYPADGGEGRLLYKNLQNVASMEYDAENHRILLETIEDTAMVHRKCIILQM